MEADAPWDEDVSNRALLVLHLRPARAHARALAVAEVVSALEDFGCTPERGGPLAQRRRTAWVSVDQRKVGDLYGGVPPLGYVNAIDLCEPVATPERFSVRWRRRHYRLSRCYADDVDELRELAPDRRAFILDGATGPRTVIGYRGTAGNVLGRRGLPVIDARLLANLTRQPPGALVLDPFAGAGGVALAVEASGRTCCTADIDRTVALGLRTLSHGRHVLADAQRLPFVDRAFCAIATETPFDASADNAVVSALVHAVRLLAAGGRLVVMCSSGQAVQLRAAPIKMHLVLDETVLRRRLRVHVMVWEHTG